MVKIISENINLLKKASHSNLEERNQFMSSTLSSYFGKSVLNIKLIQKKYLPNETKHLETDLPLKFENSSFETVCCNNVLKKSFDNE